MSLKVQLWSTCLAQAELSGREKQVGVLYLVVVGWRSNTWIISFCKNNPLKSTTLTHQWPHRSQAREEEREAARYQTDQLTWKPAENSQILHNTLIWPSYDPHTPHILPTHNQHMTHIRPTYGPHTAPIRTTLTPKRPTYKKTYDPGTTHLRPIYWSKAEPTHVSLRTIKIGPHLTCTLLSALLHTQAFILWRKTLWLTTTL